MSELLKIFGIKNPKEFIEVTEDNKIIFKLQEGPIKEVGKNGCQIDDVVQCARTIVEGFNANFSCRENSLAITKLDESLLWLTARKNNRMKRGVEGYNKE